MLIDSKTFQPVKRGLDQLWLAAWLIDALPSMHTRVQAIADMADSPVYMQCQKQAQQIAKEVNSDD